MNANAIALDARGEIRKDMPSSAYKVGDEFKPFHPSASHVSPEWRDGWNACFVAAIAALEAEPQDGDVEQALNRMDALLDPSLNLLAVSEDSITLQGCRADMLTIRRALRMAPAAREGWQPIETAPKGAYALLWIDIAIGHPLVVQGCWFHDDDENEKGWIDLDGQVLNATHWMPLPTPPKD